MTLLEICQDISNDLGEDEFNSIDDSIVSQQIAQIVKTTYFAMMSNRNWPHLKRLLKLVPSGDNNKPTHMSLQDPIKELCFINYNKAGLNEARKDYREVKWVDSDDFLRITNRRDNTSSTVDVIIDPSGVELLIATNKHPDYFTSFNDTTLVFDSYNSQVDSTLQASKLQAQAFVMPSWSHVDSAIPDLPEEAFIGLLEEAKSRASLKLKQQQDTKSEQEAGRQRRWLSGKAWRSNGGITMPNYGRKTLK